jgi:uncharacterized membrane protein YozB (DUF420 family)
MSAAKPVMSSTTLGRGVVLMVSLVAVPRVALACPVCFGQSDSPMAVAMNTGILAMLGVVVAVLAGFGLFIVNLIRRARSLERERGSDAQVFALPTAAEAQEGTASC